MLVKLLAIRYSRTQNFHDEERCKPFVFVSRGITGIHGQQTLNKASRRKIFVQKHKIGQNNYYFTAIRDNDMFFFFFYIKYKISCILFKHQKTSTIQITFERFHTQILHLCFTTFLVSFHLLSQRLTQVKTVFQEQWHWCDQTEPQAKQQQVPTTNGNIPETEESQISSVKVNLQSRIDPRFQLWV